MKIGDTQPTNKSGVHFIRVGDGGGWVLLLARCGNMMLFACSLWGTFQGRLACGSSVGVSVLILWQYPSVVLVDLQFLGERRGFVSLQPGIWFFFICPYSTSQKDRKVNPTKCSNALHFYLFWALVYTSCLVDIKHPHLRVVPPLVTFATGQWSCPRLWVGPAQPAGPGICQVLCFRYLFGHKNRLVIFYFVCF